MGSPRKRPIRTPKPKPPQTPKSPQDWDRPPRPPKGDDSQDTIFLAVGRALTAWERLEGILGLIYVEAIGQDWITGVSALRAYGTITAFSGRYDMLKAAIEAAIFQKRDRVGEDMFGWNDGFPELVEAGRVLDRIKHFSGRRNDVAHGVVDRHPKNKATLASLFDPTPQHGWVLLPSEYATGKKALADGGILLGTIQEPIYYYTAAQIDGFTQHFEKLLTEAQAYLRTLGNVLSGQISQRREDQV